MKRIPVLWAAIFCLGALLSLSIFLRDRSGAPPTFKERSLTQLLSRLGMVQVDVYKDTNMMNGPISYHFQTENAQYLIQRLRVTARNSPPQMLDIPIKHIRTDTNWHFNFDAARVYSATYCLDGGVVLFDLLLVDNRDVIYITDTYVERASSQLKEPNTNCFSGEMR